MEVEGAAVPSLHEPKRCRRCGQVKPLAFFSAGQMGAATPAAPATGSIGNRVESCSHGTEGTIG